jgi:hypothetical protein
VLRTPASSGRSRRRSDQPRNCWILPSASSPP